MTLDEAIREFNTYRAGAGYSANTVSAGREALGRFMSVTGNIQVRSLGPHHGEMFLSWMLSRGYKPRTVNLQLSMVSTFCKWARNRRLMAANTNPLSTVRGQKVNDEPRRRIPVVEFPRLLDCAQTPQERVIVALGLYLFLRSSEIVGLRVSDLDLSQGLVSVHMQKTKEHDLMPVCAELDEELRRWLTWYTEDQGGLDPEWRLVPPYRKRRIDLETTGPLLNPGRPMSNTSLKIHNVLRRFGWTVTGDDREGVHTLRRSGARALFDELSENRGRDNALRYVASMLHHKSVVITERYLGLDVDKEKRDNLLRGQPMFTVLVTDNVVRLEDVR